MSPCHALHYWARWTSKPTGYLTVLDAPMQQTPKAKTLPQRKSPFIPTGFSHGRLA